MASYFKSAFLVMVVCIVLQCWSANFSTDEGASLNSSSIRDLVISSHEETLQIVGEALHRSRQRRSAASSSNHVFTFHRQTELETQEISQAAEVFQTTLQVLKNRVKQIYRRNVMAPEFLSWEDVAQISKLSGCPPATHPAICQHNHLTKYRSLSGVCNNRQNPHWGAANTVLVRWLPAEYEDGEREPKGWNPERLFNGFQLPSPRTVSKDIVSSSTKSKDPVFSQLLVEWGQYLDHDMSFTPQNSESAAFMNGVDCSTTCENVHPCFPIKTDDMLCGAQGCLPFFRSTAGCVTSFGCDIGQALQRQQMNGITSFLDAGLVYGHNPKQENFLRDLQGRNGKLAVNDKIRDSKGRSYLPYVEMQPSACLQNGKGERVECFKTGDSRVNEGLPLMILHTIWLREHNRIAEALKQINGHWNPETIYQETRKIIGALHQIITMRDYLPNILGPESFECFIGPYRGYNPTVDPSASNVFATAVFRFGHATIPLGRTRLNESFQEHERFPNVNLHETFFSPWRIVKEGGIEPSLRGVIGTAASAVRADMLLADEVTERLVVLKTLQHMDLASLNLQRGRDHGLPGYNEWREFCGLGRINTLDDLCKVVRDCKVAEKILNLYKHPDNIDVWLGGLIENLLPGSRTGPLFSCLLGKQLKAIRDGDRFWWEADGVFTQEQKYELSKHSISRVICDNSDIEEVHPDSFRIGTYPCDYVSCDQIPSLNLEPWREEKSRDLELCGSPRPINNGDFILSSPSGRLVALYFCYHGFKLVGTASIVCDGYRWSNHPPQCRGNRP